MNWVNFILLITITHKVTSFDIKYKVTYKNKCLVSDMIVRYFLKISLRQCVKECADRPVCLSINYKRRHLLCELYSVDDGVFLENNSRSGPCVFVTKTSFNPQTLETCSCENTEACDDESMTCQRRECEKLTLKNGVIVGNLHTLGSELKFVCDEGYIESENRTYTTCEQTGTWSYLPRCTGCPEIILNKGVITGDHRTVGSELTFTCDETYKEVEDRSYTVCEPTENWSYVPRCITDSCSTASLTDFTSKYENVALNKEVTLSSELRPGYLMVDGNRDPNHPHCAHTVRGSIGQAIVDLRQTYTIYALYIVNRVDCCRDRLRNVSVTIGENPENMELHVYHKAIIGRDCTFVVVQPCVGRYVKIVNVNDEPLTICELEVYGV